MALIQPDSEIILFKGIPFDPAYNDTMFFGSLSAQTSWFSNLPAARKLQYTDMSYQRKNRNTLRIEEMYSRAYNVNYMAFKNTSFENKWFYAFVERVDYINNITVEITYTLDVIQSWLFEDPVTNLSDLFSECAIERCHTRTDAPGDHTLPENLPIGEYVYGEAWVPSEGVSSYTASPCIIVATTIDSEGDLIPDAGALYTGRIQNGSYFSGLYYRLFRANAAGVTALNAYLNLMTVLQLSKSVVAIMMGDSRFWDTSPDAVVSPYELSVQRRGRLGTYEPRNKKLLTSPFYMLCVDDNNGHENNYKWELFEHDEPIPGVIDTSVHFYVWGNRSCTSSLICYPKKYKGIEENFDEAMESAQFPACSWDNDTFLAALAQSWSTPALQMLGNLATGNMIGAAGTAVGVGVGLATLATNGENYVPSLQGVANTNLGYQANGICFDLKEKMIRPENAEVIDHYFDMYGYRVETVGIPDINARPYWTYVKTRGASVHGLLPAEDARQIEGIFNKGIRFWTTSAAAGFGNYNADNSPAS